MSTWEKKIRFILQADRHRKDLATGENSNTYEGGSPFSSIYPGKVLFGFAGNAGGVKKAESTGNRKNSVGSVLLCCV